MTCHTLRRFRLNQTPRVVAMTQELDALLRRVNGMRIGVLTVDETPTGKTATLRRLTARLSRRTPTSSRPRRPRWRRGRASNQE